MWIILAVKAEFLVHAIKFQVYHFYEQKKVTVVNGMLIIGECEVEVYHFYEQKKTNSGKTEC